MATYDLAAKYSNKVDEVFHHKALKHLVTNSDYDWNGVNTVNVYSIPTVAMNDYTRSGSNRYGSPSELGNLLIMVSRILGSQKNIVLIGNYGMD